MSISNVTQFAGALRTQINLQAGTENTQSVSPNSASEFLSQAVSSLDLSGAEYGTLLLKDKLHDQAFAYSVVTVKQQHLSSLNTRIQNVQDVVDQLAVTDPSETEAYAALVEELADREDQLSLFIGTLFHSNDLSLAAIVNPNLGGNAQNEIINVYSLWPQDFTLDNYKTIFTDSTWYMGYVNSITYTVFNTIISVSAALPAAYAFSRYKFLGDKHLFFWLLTNRMAPPAVFALPFFQFYSSVNLFDTHIAIALSHCLFNIPLAVWILEGFMSGVPREIDETAYIDGYSFPRFFTKIFTPLIASGIGVAAFFCFMFSWVELLIARTLTVTDAKPIAAAMTRTVSASGLDWGVLAAAGILTIIPGALVIYFVRHHIAKGFALGRV